MIAALLMCFVSIAAYSGGSSIQISQANTGSTQPTANITTGQYESNWWFPSFSVIGRHQMVSVDSYSYLGLLNIKTLSAYYNANALTNFSFSETISTIEETTVSTSVQTTSTITSSLAAKMGIDGVSVSDGYTVSQAYTIQQTTTYSYSVATSSTINYDVRESVVAGKRFALCEAAYVYRATCQKWQYDNYWFNNNVEVSNSRSTFYTYRTIEPFITLVFSDGSIVE
jgi:ACT domain-containing protein